MRVRVKPTSVAGVVPAPSSKSFTHRALILATLAEGETRVARPLLADDTRYTIEACRFLGAGIEVDESELRVAGTGGRVRIASVERSLFLGNSGSTMRMVAPLAALSGESVVIDGDARLRQRPMGDLLQGLGDMGIKARSLAENGCPPLEIQGGRIRGGEVAVSGLASSQHISALLMAAPYADHDTLVRVVGGFRSRPYVDITTRVMHDFGVSVAVRDGCEFAVRSGQRYRARAYIIEGDYSQAACFFAAGAVGGGPVSVSNLNRDSVQGDRRFLDIMGEMGCAIDFNKERVTVSREGELAAVVRDMGNYPDIVQPLAVAAAFTRGRTELTNIGHLQFKETERVSRMAAELGKMGIRTEMTGDMLAIYGGRPKGAELEAHGDHRMAMSLAVAALFADGVSYIAGAETVSKSYPQFFADLQGLGAAVEELP